MLEGLEDNPITQLERLLLGLVLTILIDLLTNEVVTPFFKWVCVRAKKDMYYTS